MFNAKQVVKYLVGKHTNRPYRIIRDVLIRDGIAVGFSPRVYVEALSDASGGEGSTRNLGTYWSDCRAEEFDTVADAERALAKFDLACALERDEIAHERAMWG